MTDHEIDAIAAEVAADALATLTNSVNEVLERREISTAFTNRVRKHAMTILANLEEAI